MIYDIVGMGGAALIVVAYLLLQIDRLDAKSLAFSVANAVGAALILVSLAFDFNLGAAVVEAFWLLVSCVGLWRHSRARRQRG